MVYSAKRSRTRELIKNTFIRMYREKDISRITVKDICERACINRSTFYDHYTDVFDLREKIEDETIEALQKKFKEIIAERKDLDFEEIILEIVEIARENEGIPFLLIIKNRSKYVDKIVEIIESGAFFDVSKISEEELFGIRVAVEYHFSGVVSVLARYSARRDDDMTVKLLVAAASTGPVSILKRYMMI